MNKRMTRFEDAPINDIVADYESGMTVAAVGEKYGIPSMKERYQKRRELLCNA